MFKDIIFIIKEAIPIGKKIVKSLKNAKDKKERRKIRESIHNRDSDFIDDFIKR